MAVDPTPVFWNRILDQLRQRLPSQQAFDTWFQPVSPRRVSDDGLDLEVPSLFVADWIQQHYLDALAASAAAVLGAVPEVRFTIRPDLELVRYDRPEDVPVGAARPPAAAASPAVPMSLTREL